MAHLKLKKKAWAGLALAAVLGVAGIGSVFAYYTDQENALNKVTVGFNDIVIEETFEQPDELDAGISFKKDPKVTNTGNVDCVVRIFAEYNRSDVAEFVSTVYELEDGTTAQFNSDDWTAKQADGYYYYKHILAPGETTEPLFTSVSVSDTVDKSKLTDFEIMLYAESSQLEAAHSDVYNGWLATQN